MAITVGTPVSGIGSNVAAASTVTINSVAVSGTDRALVVMVVARGTTSDTDDTIGTVVFNGGESLTRIGTIAITTAPSVRVAVYRLVAPTATTANVVITVQTSASHIVGIALPMAGVDQLDPDDAAETNSGTSTTPNVTVSSATGDYVLGCIGHRDTSSTFTADGDTTELDRDENSGAGAAHIRGILTKIDGAASVSPSGVLNNSEAWVAVGFNFNAAVSGARIRSDRRRRAMAVLLKRGRYKP